MGAGASQCMVGERISKPKGQEQTMGLVRDLPSPCSAAIQATPIGRFPTIVEEEDEHSTPVMLAETRGKKRRKGREKGTLSPRVL